jgi:hypothetical protein
MLGEKPSIDNIPPPLQSIVASGWQDEVQRRPLAAGKYINSSSSRIILYLYV